jgi:TetR/AcrR family transcriptional regulator, cholesterol catabolism regulator
MPRPSRWNEIVEAAAKLFQEKGYASTSLEDIAGAVGIWKGSLYHYIDSKEELLLAVVREPAAHILEQIREIATLDLPAAEKIRRVAHAHAHTLDETFVYASVYLQEIAGRSHSAEWSAMDREYLATIVKIVEKGVADGDFAPYVDPRIATLTLVGSLNWMTHWYRPDGPLPATAIAEQICTVFLQGAVRRSTG